MLGEPPDSPPDWSQSEHWDEFQWEQALRYSDHLAARYFELMHRFGDLPDADEFITAHLGEFNLDELEDVELYTADENELWRDEDDDDDDDDDEDDEAEGRRADGEGPVVGDSLFYETTPVYQRARQLSLGWCNIQASVIVQRDRMWGVRVLYYFGRVLAYLSLAIGDGSYDRPHATVAFLKRALAIVNTILGELEAKSEDQPPYGPTFDYIRKHLFEVHDLMEGMLLDTRKRAREEGE